MGPLIAATAAQTITIPYTFAPIDFSGYSGPDLPTLDFAGIDFINLAGSIALTLYKMIDDLGVLGYFALIMVAVMIIFWIWSFVTRTSSTPSINMSGAIDTGAQLYANYQNQPLQQEIDMIESADFSNDESTGRLAGPTVALNKSLMAGNRINANNFRRAARLVRGSRRVKWW